MILLVLFLRARKKSNKLLFGAIFIKLQSTTLWSYFIFKDDCTLKERKEFF